MTYFLDTFLIEFKFISNHVLIFSWNMYACICVCELTSIKRGVWLIQQDIKVAQLSDTEDIETKMSFEINILKDATFVSCLLLRLVPAVSSFLRKYQTFSIIKLNIW